MSKLTLLALLSITTVVSATYIPRAAPGTQFITGPCTVDADCASGCCAFNTGKCAGAIIALTRDGGCGHGDGQSNARAAAVLRGNCPGTKVKRERPSTSRRYHLCPRTPLAPHVGNDQGEQFITGQCLSDADCASGCCAVLGDIGICSGPAVANEQGKSGCGFNGNGGSAMPSTTTQNGNSESDQEESTENDLDDTSSSSPPVEADGPATSGSSDIGAGCDRDSNCGTACCGFNSGKCVLAKTAPGSDGGCGRGEASPNARAAGVIDGNAPIC
ncbi:hypothetical protein L218DRAFT_1062894 [Marasmius fiardii PR-910]|nr:hypothetical protein L218DRAFT_1062894 [Marasmius fiardii PR-910]